MSQIEWTDHAHNGAVTGCSPASEGCRYCWAARQSATRLSHLAARVGPSDGELVPHNGRHQELVRVEKQEGRSRYVYNGRVAFDPVRTRAALRIPQNGGKRGPRVFWNSRTDTYHGRITFTEIAAQYAAMAQRQDLKFLILTKRPERALSFHLWVEDMVGYLANRHGAAPPWVTGTWLGELAREVGVPAAIVGLHVPWPLPNVALGVSAENQKWWDRRVRILRQIPAAMRFVSVEPMLGQIIPPSADTNILDQVIIGAESGPGAREMKLEWARGLGHFVLNARAEALRMKARFPHWAETDRRVPALFVKQADVCERCHGCGHGEEYDVCGHRSTQRTCEACGGSGKAGRIRKGCPRLCIRGFGSEVWDQRPEGW